ncbi:tripartite tricarboxylate transporter substrate binding protein [Reyranella sp.]|uniref:Bug family tripartite tricarboxylate transporter substrate binding protein n=1 Tax=Reyranella sp. TaxID=1929291 RepID=UPI0025D59882|nr:tripartite tricarboxylate transporter substrate binding protein [Reyranella sp.]
MKLTRRTVLAASAATLGSSLAAPAVKASPGWPTRQPIKLIATFPPGGTADTISRILAPKLSAGLGTQVVVENRPGAGGTIGSDLAAKAPPDGYTLVISHASPLGIAPGIYPKLPYNVITDFTHVTLIGHTPNVLIVPGDSPYKTLADYIAAAKARPDEIAFGSSGIGSNTHLMGELLGSLAGIKLKHVPYRGSAPSLQDMLAGAIPSMFDPITTNVPHINSGKVRLLAVSSDKRLDMYPNAPTFAEQGFPKLTTSTWVGVSGPKGMSPDVVARLYDELQKAYKAPEVVERFKEVVLLPGDKPMTPAEYTAFVGDFAALWAGVSKSAGIELELG